MDEPWRVALPSGAEIELSRGDITRQEGLAAVVNAANAELLPGGGVAGAIHRAAGPGLAEECRQHAPIRTGEAVLTGGHRLPNPWVIHCLGPVYGVDESSADLLASCYRNALELAERHALDSVAFPAISTGIFGYPMAEAAEVALRAITDLLPSLRRVRRVRLVLASREAFDVHVAALERLVAGGAERQET